MHTIESISPVPETRMLPGAHVALTGIDIEHVQSDLLAQMMLGPNLTLPNYLTPQKGEQLVVPSVEIVTPRGNAASLVSLVDTDKRMKRFYEDTARSRSGMRDRLSGMAIETAVRILDTSGDMGLHHVHDTIFPHTVFQVVKRGQGVQSSLYMTRLGQRQDNSPVFGVVTATRDKRAEYELFRTIGAGNQKRRHNP